MTSVSLPLATSIGGYAFEYCEALTSVSLPAVTSIGDDLFDGSALLTEVAMPPTPPTFGTQTTDPPTGTVFIVPKTPAYEIWTVPAGTTWIKEYIAPSGTTSVQVGGNIDLSCQSITATTGMTYQWQKNISGTWTDIAGETGVAYAKSGAALADSGEYRVMINYGGITSYTDPITVTVGGAAPDPGGKVDFTVNIYDDDGKPISADRVDEASKARLSSDFGLEASIDNEGRVVISGTATNSGVVNILVTLKNSEKRAIIFRIDLSRSDGNYITDVKVSKADSSGEAPSGSSGGGGCSTGVGPFALFVLVGATVLGRPSSPGRPSFPVRALRRFFK
jgi:hypothetical protein